jgi:uncharacterized membrane protein (UPF0127 family)
MTTARWLLRDGTVLATTEVADSYTERMRGLSGRSGFDGALLLPGARAVHTMGMRFAIDVAFLDRNLKVLELVHVRPWRLTLPRVRARCVLEAEGGAFERWGLCAGDELELHDIP